VFPIVNDDDLDSHEEAEGIRENAPEHRDTDTITSLSGLPSWLSMPSLPVQRQPHALMTIDLDSSRDLSGDMDNISKIMSGTDERERRTRLRVKSHQRLRSYKQIMEDLQEQAKNPQQRKTGTSDKSADNGDTNHKFDDEGEFDHEDGDDQDHIDVWYTPTHSLASSPMSSPRKQRREDTARRSKRFSLPAIALHTTSVTARTSDVPDSSVISRESSSGDLSAGLGRSKRFSLVLAAERNSYADGSNKASPSNEEGGESGGSRSVAAAKLSELLGRKTKA
jgi:FYVE/RhoGEF/PH domain-containing protein 5/6